MKAITTKYHGPTNSRPARYTAAAGSNRISKTILVPVSGGFGIAVAVVIPGPYNTLSAMRAANKAKSAREDSGCYFGRAEMRFFNSRPAHTVIAGRFFIDTTQYVDVRGGYKGPRKAKVCMVDDAGNVEHVAFPPPGWDGRARSSTRQDSCLVTTLQWTEEYLSVDDARLALKLFLM